MFLLRFVCQAEEDEEEVVDPEPKPAPVIFEPGDVIGPLGGVLCRKKAARTRSPSVNAFNAVII